MWIVETRTGLVGPFASKQAAKTYAEDHSTDSDQFFERAELDPPPPEYPLFALNVGKNYSLFVHQADDGTVSFKVCSYGLEYLMATFDTDGVLKLQGDKPAMIVPRGTLEGDR